MVILTSLNLMSTKFKSELSPQLSIHLTESLLKVDTGELNQTLLEVWKDVEQSLKQEDLKEKNSSEKEFLLTQFTEHGQRLP